MRILAALILFVVVVGLFGTGAILFGFYLFGRGLPDYQQLANYNPPVVTRIHAGDGRLMAEFAEEKRVFVPVQAMPKRLIKAFLSAEDKTFYSHPGVSILAIIKAAIINLRYINSDRRPIGASTITQQVAKNFLLTNEVSINRKIKEVILSLRIERTFSKDQILELYLNEIYLGFSSYGIAAAALNYFDKSLDNLTLGEIAFLAGLPKAPNNYHPSRYPNAARARRDYVLNRMVEDGHISMKIGFAEMAKPITMRPISSTDSTRAEYFVEDVRRELLGRFGRSGLYGGGLSVRTTLDTNLQSIAESSLRYGLSAYDRRHGWRGPLGRIDLQKNWRSDLEKYRLPNDVTDWLTAVAVEPQVDSTLIAFADGSRGILPWSEMRWARISYENGKRRPRAKQPSDILKPGDVIAVEPLPQKSGINARSYSLRQIPEVSGGIVVMDPHTGRVLAMSGGFSAALSSFNRATQAKRQPGAAFKPFVYLAALDKGFTPSSQVLDAPFVINQGPGLPRWRPANYSKKFYGPSPLRLGLEKSRNLMTVRLAHNLGMDVIAQYAERFDLVENMPRYLSMALGASETTLIRLTAAYATLVNGGRRVKPTLIDKIQDRTGKTIFRHDIRSCNACPSKSWNAKEVPILSESRKQIINPKIAYQVVSMLEGVVKRGTGRRINTIRKPLAGKTGTTNDSKDTWFVGFSPDLTVGVFVGFDKPRPLGRGETGSSVAAPVFKKFMEVALKDRSAIPFRVPAGLQLVRVNARTGRPASGTEKSVILEAFLPGTVPTRQGPVLDGSDQSRFNPDDSDLFLRKLQDIY